MSSSINEPRQRRSRLLMERVTEAGLEQLEEQPFEAFTIGTVSERAGVSVGAIYRRFGSKERLLRHLHERVVVKAEARTGEIFDVERFTGLPTAELVAAAVRAFVALAEQDRRLHAAFVRVAEGDPEVGSRSSRYADVQRERFLALLASRGAEYAHEDPDAAAAVVYRLVFGVLLPTVLLGDYELTPAAPWSGQVVDELARACVVYLLTPVPEPFLT